MSVVFPAHLIVTFILQIRKEAHRGLDLATHTGNKVTRIKLSPCFKSNHFALYPTGSDNISHLLSFCPFKFFFLNEYKLKLETAFKIWPCSLYINEHHWAFRKTAYKKHKSVMIFKCSYCVNAQCFCSIFPSATWRRQKKNENERVNKNFDKFQSGNNSLKNTIDHILTCKYPWGRGSSRSKWTYINVLQTICK